MNYVKICRYTCFTQQNYNITKIKNFPNLLNLNQIQRDKLIINFFNLSELEEIVINNSLHNYNHFIDLL